MALNKKDRILKVFGFGLVLLFALLIFKDPFSERTLIPNFEPHPDTFFYINPALSLIKGEGFNMNRESRIIELVVPPLYSLALLPSFFIKQDPRMAYYANVILAFVSLFFFWLILKKLFTSKLLTYFLAVLYITNYFIYWVPSLVMAENLTLTLFLSASYFLLCKLNKINLSVLAVLAVGIYATKYASIPITAVLVFVCLFRILLSKQIFSRKVKLMLYFGVTLVLCYMPVAIFEQVTKGSSIISQSISVLSLFYKSVPSNISEPKVVANSWFGIKYINHNLPLYLNSLLGKPNKFLWDNTPIVPGFIGAGGLIGLFFGIITRKFRFISFVLLFFVLSSVIFMSAFYTNDARYIYIAIPTLIIGFGIFLKTIGERIFKQRFVFNVFILIFILFYLGTNFVRIKSQISLNLRYAETPWYYISVLKLNEYFTKDKIIDGKKPVVISALPPFLVDYYSNGNYTLLPLSYEQEFRSLKEKIWGTNDYSNLPELYTKYLKDGYDVYVSRAGLGNEGYTNEDFNVIITNFNTKLVQPGCYDQCNIYSVKLKNINLK